MLATGAMFLVSALVQHSAPLFSTPPPPPFPPLCLTAFARWSRLLFYRQFWRIFASLPQPSPQCFYAKLTPRNPMASFQLLSTKDLEASLCVAHAACGKSLLVFSCVSGIRCVESRFSFVCLFVSLCFALLCSGSGSGSAFAYECVVVFWLNLCPATPTVAHTHSHTLAVEDRKSAYSHFIHKQFIRPLERRG